MMMTATETATDNNTIDEENLCDICCDNKYTYQCSYCHYKFCSECFKKILFESSTDNPHELMSCINCHRPLSFGEMIKIITIDEFQHLLQIIIDKRLILEKQNDGLVTECEKKINLKLSIIKKLPVSIIDNLKFILGRKGFHNVSISGQSLSQINYFIESTHFSQLRNLEVLKCLLSFLKNVVYNPSLKTFDWNQQTQQTALSITKLLKQPFCLRYIPHGRTNKPEISELAEKWRAEIVEYEQKVKEAFNDYNDILTYDEFIFVTTYKLTNEAILNTIKEFYSSHFEAKKNDEGYKYAFRCEKPNCHGLVDAITFKCNSCDTQYCKLCLKSIEGEHTCDDNDKLTASSILYNSRPCPRCAARIYRVSGCNQMFCTNCHTGFNWNDGKLILYSFDNPHRTEWLENRILTDTENDDDLIHDQSTIDEIAEWRRRVYELNIFLDLVHNNTARFNDINFKLFELRVYYFTHQINERLYKERVGEIVKSSFILDVLNQIYQDYIESIRRTLIKFVRELNLYIRNKQKQFDDEGVKFNVHDFIGYLYHENQDMFEQAFNKIDELFVKHKDDVKEISKEWFDYVRDNDLSNKLIFYSLNENIISVQILKEVPRFTNVDDEMEQLTIKARNDLTNWQYTFGNIPLVKPITPTYAKLKYLDYTDEGYLGTYTDAVDDRSDFDNQHHASA